MQNQEGPQSDGEINKDSTTSNPTPEFEDWSHYADNDIMQQQSSIMMEEAEKLPFVGDKARETTKNCFLRISLLSFLFEGLSFNWKVLPKFGLIKI